MGMTTLGAVCAAAAALAWQYRRDARRARSWREGLLDGCDAVPELPGKRSVDPAGFVRFDGVASGVAVTVELIHDDAGFRKLPVLWLALTLSVEHGGPVAWSAMRRPQGTEFWSAADRLPHRLATPGAWPADVVVRAGRGFVPSAGVVETGTRFFADERSKELALSSRGVRCVSRVAEARRGEYLVLRKSRFDVDRVAPAQVCGLLELGLALCAAAGALRVPGRNEG